MGAGALTANKISELQTMESDDAVEMLAGAGVAKVDATVVVDRVRRMNTGSLVDGETIALLVEGLSPNAQDALVELMKRSPRTSPFKARQRSDRSKLSWSREMEPEVVVPDNKENVKTEEEVEEEICNYETLRSVNKNGSYVAPEMMMDSYLAPPEASLVEYVDENCLGDESEEHDLPEQHSFTSGMVTWRPPAMELEVGRVEKGRWKLGKLIGSGSYGQVFQGLNLDTGALIAIKTLILPSYSSSEQSLGRRELGTIRREIELMSSLQHPNIVSYLGAEADPAQSKLHIFQEWVPGGSLSQVLRQFGGKFDDAVTRRYLVHLLRGLVYLHEHRIVHRDIKGENVLISEQGVAKLADMGASKRISADGTLNDTNSLKGTPYFMAPEQMRQKRVGRKADVWAIGGVALLMATGEPPWRALEAKSPYALMVAVIQSKEGPPLGSYSLQPELKTFIESCFIRDAEKRPSSEALVSHRFLLSSNQDDVRSSAERAKFLLMNEILTTPSTASSERRRRRITSSSDGALNDERPFPGEIPLVRPQAPESRLRASNNTRLLESSSAQSSSRPPQSPSSFLTRATTAETTSMRRKSEKSGLTALRSRIRATTPPTALIALAKKKATPIP